MSDSVTTYTAPKKRVPTAYALAKREAEKTRKAAERAYEEWFEHGPGGQARMAKRHWGHEMSKLFDGLENARYFGADNWHDLESCVSRFAGGCESAITARNALVVKNLKIVARLAQQTPPPADLHAQQQIAFRQHSNHYHTLLAVARRTAELQAEIQHCRDELALANAEHIAWLLDGTPCADTPFHQAAQARRAAGPAAGPAGKALRKALTVKRQKT